MGRCLRVSYLWHKLGCLGWWPEEVHERQHVFCDVQSSAGVGGSADWIVEYRGNAAQPLGELTTSTVQGQFWPFETIYVHSF